MITLEQYWMGRDKQFADQLTDEIKTNAAKLLSSVESFLAEVNYTQKLEVSSGWRPAAINAGVGNAAKKSLHMLGLAVDLKDDKSRTLWKLCAANPECLRKHGLFLEDEEATRGKWTNWVHLDISPTRSDRPSRVFKP